ncbi:MAG: hemin uptake protein HemP [Paracoccaceae bacterium]|nr:hemin uptake protein HemP [Paracoccaceae bacterium]
MINSDRQSGISLDAISETKPKQKNEHASISVNKFDALDLIGNSNRAVISLGSQEYILRLTKQHKLILTK